MKHRFWRADLQKEKAWEGAASALDGVCVQALFLYVLSRNMITEVQLRSVVVETAATSCLLSTSALSNRKSI